MKSARTSSQGTIALDDMDEEKEIDENFSDGDPEHFSEGNSAYDVLTNRGKAPPAKRAKKTSKHSSAKGSRRKRTLSLLPTMPLDVLFEVFSHLSPRDIINLSRTSRIFRDTLMTRNATSVWKGARERLGAPECPSAMSEPQWAVLLFGHLCQSCGAKNIPKPEFGLLRRLCLSCKKSNFLVESRLKTRFPDVDPGVLELIPYTNVCAWSHGYTRSSRYFWIPDIDAVLQKIAEYERKIHHHLPGAQQALADFKAQQIEVVKSIREPMHKWERWFDLFDLQRSQDKSALIDQRFEAITSKFLELGYVADDMAYVRTRRECRQTAPLTDRIWSRIRPALEPAVLQCKRHRLERETRYLRSARQAIVHASYEEYKKTLSPSQWNYLPRTVDICAMEPFATVVDARADIVVTAADFEEAFCQLPELLSARSDARKRHADSLVKIPRSANQSSPIAPEPGDIMEGVESSQSCSNSTQADVSDLATAVFTCLENSCQNLTYRGGYLFGWDGIAQHHCKSDLGPHPIHPHWIRYDSQCEPGPPKIDFSEKGSEIAAAVVRAAGLDDRVATVADMDVKAKDIRFGCSVCPPTKENTMPWMKRGYKWREFVSHCTARSHAAVEDVIVVLPPDVVGMVKESELTNPQLSEDKWTCGRCNVHFGDLKSREVVVAHLKSAHEVDSPHEPGDLFQFRRNASFLTFEAGYPVEPPVFEEGSPSPAMCQGNTG
ncbi:hypothetical protein M413DRAFT_449606 [Hebeloma cylindrosporum]|uniref:F-box domain-containing protein n=1 Tax=Hebeloma cylindrosporum TaxID=76867 RepID=A0A0C3BUP3_HEBCY|nr:hypothetical protein M413DRAFT_449606 [Hebeloma cylindrosporum h7]